MAFPSALFSFASRILSLRNAHTARLIHSARGHFALATETSTGEETGDTSFADTEGTELQDIEVDDTLSNKDFFGVRKLCTPQLLFEHKVHYGHKASSLDPGMKQFVYGFRSNQVIFDLDIANYHMQEALNIAAHIALRDGIILFVARLPHCANLIESTAKECGEFAHTRTWRMGTLTDIKSVQRMECRLPDLLILPSTLSEFGKEHPAVHEAAKLNIPTIAIVDSNCCPDMITYPVPGNDDTSLSIQLYCDLFKEAIARGKKERARRVALLEQEIAAEEQKRQSKLSWNVVK